MNLDRIVDKALQNRFKNLIARKTGFAILIEPVSKCNLACKYCAANAWHYRDRPFKVMPKQILDDFIEKITTFASKYGISYEVTMHGYEPLQAGLEFFQYVQDKFKETGYPPRKFGLQTNGVLLTEEWDDFFVENRWGVGFSIDGPKEYHDANRVFITGRGSYDIVIKNFRRLREKYQKNGGDVGTISVITKAHMKPTIDEAVEKFYNWILQERLRMPYVHWVSVDPTNPEVKKYAPTEDELIQWYTKLYELWKNREDGVSIDIFERIVEAMVAGRSRRGTCFMRNHCWNVISIDYQGIVHLCDRWSYILGPISKYKKFEEILFDKTMRIQAARPVVLRLYNSECKKCKYFNICQGGCANEAIDRSKMYGDHIGGVEQWNTTQYCRLYKTLFQMIERDLRARGVPLRI